MNSRLWLTTLALWSFTTAQAQDFESVRSKALAGDYIAQRNLAYGYSSAPYRGQDRNELLACAWRHVIVRSGNERVDQTDINNLQVFCGQLDATQGAAAMAQAKSLYRRVYSREMGP
jgi:hypothetical protein